MNRRIARQHDHQRGVALILVMIALAVATVLSLSFLARQGTTLGIARNLDRHAQARQIAEAGLLLAAHEIDSNADWRTDHAEGAEWAAGQPMSGGTLTVRVDDGEDADGDGEIGAGETDGDLADGAGDPVTVTAVGRYGGVTHRLRGVVVPVTTTTGGGGSAYPAQSVFVTGTLKVSGSGYVNSYDPATGQFGNNATIITNSVSGSAASASGGAYFGGDLYIADGGGFQGYNWGNTGLTGQVKALPEPQSVTVPPQEVTQAASPALSIGGAPGWHDLGVSGAVTKLRYTSLSGGGSKKFRINGDVRLRVDGNFSLGGASGLELSAGSRLTMWVGGNVDIGSGLKVNADLKDPSRVVIYGTGNGDVNIGGSADVYAAIIYPEADLKIGGSGELFGTFQGKTLDVSGGAALHQYTSGLSNLPGFGGGASTSTRYVLQWIENP